jgi:hypothetical protein
MKKRNGFVSNSSSSSFIIDTSKYLQMTGLLVLKNLKDDDLLKLSFIQNSIKKLKYHDDAENIVVKDFKNLLLDLEQGYFEPVSKQEFLDMIYNNNDYSDYHEMIIERNNYDKEPYYKWEEIGNYNDETMLFFMKKFGIIMSNLISSNRYYSIIKLLSNQKIRRDIYEDVFGAEIERNKFTKKRYKPYIKMSNRQFFNEVIVKVFYYNIFENRFNFRLESILIDNEKKVRTSVGVMRLMRQCVNDILINFREIYKRIDKHLDDNQYLMAEYSDGGGEGNTNISVEYGRLLEEFKPLRIINH